MAWVELFTVFVVCHLTGDFLLQTNWQALNKRGGLGRDPEKRRALAMHILTYSLAFVPAFAWICAERDIGWALLAVVLVGGPHWIQDDGRLVNAYARKVKKLKEPPDPVPVWLMVDQSFHLLALFALALWIGY